MDIWGDEDVVDGTGGPQDVLKWVHFTVFTTPIWTREHPIWTPPAGLSALSAHITTYDHIYHICSYIPLIGYIGITHMVIMVIRGVS